MLIYAEFSAHIRSKILHFQIKMYWRCMYGAMNECICNAIISPFPSHSRVTDWINEMDLLHFNTNSGDKSITPYNIYLSQNRNLMPTKAHSYSHHTDTHREAICIRSLSNFIIFGMLAANSSNIFKFNGKCFIAPLSIQILQNRFETVIKMKM